MESFGPIYCIHYGTSPRRYLYDFSINYEDTNFQGIWEGGGVVKSKIFSALPTLNFFSKVRQYKIAPLLPSSIPLSLLAKSSCNVNVHMRANIDSLFFKRKC